MTLNLNPEWFLDIETGDISDLDGWLDFVNKRDAYHPPPLITRAEYEALPRGERRDYDLARKIANNNLPKHETPMTNYARDQIEAVLNSNLYRMDPGVRSGIFISADGNLGKSTLMREIAADYDADIRRYRELFPNSIKTRDRWVPVMWVTVPPKLSIRNLGLAILHFYGEHAPKGSSDSHITARVEAVIRDCGTRLAVLDDITRYKDGEADRFAADWIRNLMETSVSIIAMGVDIRGSGILHDGQGRARNQRLSTQTARRFTVIELDTFSYDTKAEIDAWRAHLKAIEEDLLLIDKQPGMLSGALPEFLYDRTDGVIGVLTDYVQTAATKVIGRSPANGGEFLTRAEFNAVPLKSNDALTLAPEPEIKKRQTRPRGKGRNTMYDQAKKAGAA